MQTPFTNIDALLESIKSRSIAPMYKADGILLSVSEARLIVSEIEALRQKVSDMQESFGSRYSKDNL